MLQPQNDVIALTPQSKKPDRVYLDRRELSQILNLYGQMVAAGFWKDYALHFGDQEAQFAIYRRASEAPLYRIVKAPALARAQGAWRIVGQAGQILKRGQQLAALLTFFDRKKLNSV